MPRSWSDWSSHCFFPFLASQASHLYLWLTSLNSNTFIETFIHFPLEVHMFQHSVECFNIHICIDKGFFTETHCSLLLSFDIMVLKIIYNPDVTVELCRLCKVFSSNSSNLWVPVSSSNTLKLWYIMTFIWSSENCLRFSLQAQSTWNVHNSLLGGLLVRNVDIQTEKNCSAKSDLNHFGVRTPTLLLIALYKISNKGWSSRLVPWVLSTHITLSELNCLSI